MALKFFNKKKKKVKGNSFSQDAYENTALSGMRVNIFVILIGGAALFIAGVMFYLLIIKGVFGEVKIDEMTPTKKNIEEVLNKRTEVAILYSKYTENLLEEGSTWLIDNISTWEKFLKSHKIPYKILNDHDVELGAEKQYKVLIMPGSRVLSDKEVAEIKLFIKNGGSLFSTGGPATFSPDGKWAGWKFFNEVFGLKFTKEIDPEEGTTRIHTVRGNLPITTGVPTGYTLDIATWDRPIYAEVLEPRTIQASYWYDFRREHGLVIENIQKSAGSAFGKYGKGRFVWYGFELNSVIGNQQDYIYFDRFFSSSLDWLLHLPTAEIVDWPPPYKAAAVMVPIVSNEPQNLKNFTGIFGTSDASTIFTDAEKLPENRNYLLKYAAGLNIGLVLDIGYVESFEDTTNALYSISEQNDILKNAKMEADSLLGIQVKKLMPKYGYFDKNTLSAMSKNGYNLIFTDSLTDRIIPKTEIFDGNKIFIVGNTARDDYRVIRNFGLKDLHFQEYTYEEDVDRVEFTGGLYVFKIHTDGQLKSENIPVIRHIINYIQKKNIWFTTLDELQNWWFKRGSVEINYTVRGKRRISIEVSNPSDEAIKDFMVKIYLNKSITDLKVSSDIINTKLPSSTFDESTQSIYLTFDLLDAHDSRSILLDFKNKE